MEAETLYKNIIFLSTKKEKIIKRLTCSIEPEKL